MRRQLVGVVVVPDVDAGVDVGRDVVADPVARAARVAGEGGELVVGRGEHGLDARPGERGDRPGVGVEELHPVDPVGAQHLDHRGRVDGVRHHRAPVHPHGRRRRGRRDQEQGHHGGGGEDDGGSGARRHGMGGGRGRGGCGGATGCGRGGGRSALASAKQARSVAVGVERFLRAVSWEGTGLKRVRQRGFALECSADRWDHPIASPNP